MGGGRTEVIQPTFQCQPGYVLGHKLQWRLSGNDLAFVLHPGPSP